MRPEAIVHELHTVESLSNFALDWVAPELFVNQPKLVFLNGAMGSGKTTFVTKIADVLGAGDAASPSFALHTRYEGVRGTIDHFDLDRLQSLEDLESIGFWDLLTEAAASDAADPTQAGRRFVTIEWASRLSEFGVRSGDWLHKFRVWSMDFEGPPAWRVRVTR